MSREEIGGELNESSTHGKAAERKYDCGVGWTACCANADLLFHRLAATSGDP